MTTLMSEVRCGVATAQLATRLIHLSRYADRACRAVPLGMNVDRTLALEAITDMEEQLASIKAALDGLSRPLPASQVGGMAA